MRNLWLVLPATTENAPADQLHAGVRTHASLEEAEAHAQLARKHRPVAIFKVTPVAWYGKGGPLASSE